MLIIVAVIAGSLESDKRQTRKQVAAAQKIVSSAPTPISKPKLKYVHTPVDPKDFGMLVISNESLPKSQEHADAFVEKIVKESGVLQEKRVVEEIQDIRISQEEFSKRENIIDERIKHYQAKKEADPADEESTETLNRLYLLKAMQNKLKGTVTGSINPTPAPPQPQLEEIPATSQESISVNQP